MKLARLLFGHLKTDMLHQLLVGNGISLVPGLLRLALGSWPDEWFGWSVKMLEISAVALLGGTVLLEIVELRTRGDRRRYWDVPWPELP